MSAGHQHNPGTNERNLRAGLAYYTSIADAYKSVGYDLSAGQDPKHGVCLCSDTRQDFGVTTGLVPSVDSVSIVSTPLGQVLKYSNPGAFMTDPNGEVEVAAGKWLELCKHYGVNEVVLVQHSGCGQMNVIDTYHKAEGGKEAIMDGFGPYFAGDAERREKLVATVEKNGFAYYENTGIKLIGTDAQKRQQAMAIEQLLVDAKAVNALVAKDPKHYPRAAGVFQHIVAGKFYDLNSEGTKFEEVAAPTPDRRPGCGCGCNHKHAP